MEKKFSEKKFKKLSLQKAEEIVNFYKDGFAIAKIAEKFNVSYAAIWKILNNRNIERRRFKELTTEEIKKVVLLYNEGVSSLKIAKIFGVCKKTILKKLKINNVKRRPLTIGNRKYEIYENFFDNIDSEEKAYFLGILYADGYNGEKGHTVSLSLIEKDKEILYKLNKLVHPIKELRFVQAKKRKNNYNIKNQYILTINNKHISEKLAELGCMQAKTFKIVFPGWLDKNLHKFFMLGYFDGDGYIGKNEFSIAGTESFCKKISEILKELNVNSYIRKSGNISVIRTGGRNQLLKIYNFLYKNATIYMDRKKLRFEEVLNLL